MLIRCGLLILFLSCEYTTGNTHDGIDGVSDFSFWPSVLNAAKLMRVRREDQKINQIISEGSVNELSVPSPTTTQAPQQVENNGTISDVAPKEQGTSQGLDQGKQGSNLGPSNPKSNVSDVTSGQSVTNSISNVTNSISNDTNSGTSDSNSGPSNATLPSTISNNTTSHVVNATEPVKQFDFNNPGVIKRGFIVFGGFALLAIAYYIFYRTKGKNNSSNTHSLTDTNQFRYGVLQSEDKRDTELSRIPLTMESDDDDEEDLEIFDLEQKKKSLSYVNLQTNDEDVVFSLKDQEDDDRGNLLLDIEDNNSDTLINWSSNGNNKSIL